MTQPNPQRCRISRLTAVGMAIRATAVFDRDGEDRFFFVFNFGPSMGTLKQTF